MPLAVPWIVLGAPAATAAADAPSSQPDCSNPDSATSCDGVTAPMPGVFAMAFVPAGPRVAYSGGGVELAAVWKSDGGDSGPGRGSFFGSIAILRAPDDADSLGLFEAGMTFSFEVAPRREILVPFWGFTFGKLVHSELPDGAYFHGRLGVHLLFVHNVVLDLSGGYHYPFEHIDEMQGPRVQLTLRTALW